MDRNPNATRTPDAKKRDFTVGMEEELFLVDGATYACVTEMPDGFRSEAERRLGPHFSLEMVPSTIELVSGCHQCISDLAREMRDLRREAVAVADSHGLALLACGTHPFSDWIEQPPTSEPRYESLAGTIGASSLRSHACGLHVHVGLDDEERRVAVLNRVQQFLPLFLALSTSSPFWRGRDTRLKSYRTAVNHEMPRSGLPGEFASAADYHRLVRQLVRAGLITDESYVWWAIRLSSRFPTIELRAPDCCTRLEDGVTLAALYQSLVATLAETWECGRAAGNVARLINGENLWQASRHGIAATLVDCNGGPARTVADVLADLVEFVTPAAGRLGCLEAVRGVEMILERGTSAEAQVAIFAAAANDGASPEGATIEVAHAIAEATADVGRSAEPEVVPGIC